MQPREYIDSAPRLPRRTWLWAIIGIAGLIVLGIILCLLFVFINYRPVRFVGQSMMPTLGDKDRLFITKGVDKLQRGDIVVFFFPENRKLSYIKRIVGLPGETIEVQDGKVMINGALLNEPYMDAAYWSSDTEAPITIPANHYFMLGDNRRNSSDSRAWGTVPRELIYGKFWYRYASGQDEK